MFFFVWWNALEFYFMNRNRLNFKFGLKSNEFAIYKKIWKCEVYLFFSEPWAESMTSFQTGPASPSFPSYSCSLASSLVCLVHSTDEAQWPAPAIPVETTSKNRDSLSPSERSSPNRIKMNPHSNPAMLRDRVPTAHDKEPKSPINRVASSQIFANIRAQTVGCHLARRHTAADLPLLNRCPVDRLWCPPPPFYRFPTMSGPWSLLPPSPKAKA
jgi:hypothetical protein